MDIVQKNDLQSYYNFERKVVGFTLSQVDIHPKETTFIAFTIST